MICHIGNPTGSHPLITCTKVNINEKMVGARAVYHVGLFFLKLYLGTELNLNILNCTCSVRFLYVRS